MGSQAKNQCSAIVLVVVTIIFGSCPQQILAAGRVLEGEQWLDKNLGNIQSLQRGPVPSGGSPCTHIPGRGTGKCSSALGEMNFAGGHVVAHPPPPPPAAFPDAILSFAAAWVTNETIQPLEQ